MDDASKPKDKETPETPVEDVKEEIVEEPKSEETVEEESPKEETAEETSEPVEGSAEEEGATEEQPTDVTKEASTEPEVQEKPVKVEETKEPKKEIPKKKDHKDDFKYIVRLANTDIDGEKTFVRGLTSIKGVGMHISVLIANETSIDKYVKMGDLTDAQIEKIQKALDNITNSAPGWMLNRRKDSETGEDIHLIGSDIDMRLRDEINIMK